MKKILLTSLLGVSALGVYAQGTLLFSDYGTTTFTYSSHILTPNLSNLSAPVITGNLSGAASTALSLSAADSPAGNTVYPNSVAIGGTGATGLWANGNLFTVQLEAVAGASTVPVSSLAPIAEYTVPLSYPGNAGQFQNPSNDGQATDPGISGSTTSAAVAVACWYSGPNTTYNGSPIVGVSSLAAAETTPNAVWGESAEVINPLLAPSTPPSTQQPELETPTFDLTYNPTSTPEPSTIALGVMAASAFIIRRRKS